MQGVVEIEEGEVNGQELTLSSHSVARISFAKEPHVQQVRMDSRILEIMLLLQQEIL